MSFQEVIESYQEDEEVEEEIRFKQHTWSNIAYWQSLGFIFLVSVLIMFYGNQFEIFGYLIVICEIGYIAFSIKIKDDVENKLWPLGMFKGKYLREFCGYENRLIGLMENTHGIPSTMNDHTTTIKAEELDDEKVVFKISMRDVVGGIQFIEKNANAWAACFGDRDGASIKQVSTGVYLLTFDLLSSYDRERLEVAYA